MKDYKLMLGDNIESLKKLADNSIDSVVTDPPYGLSAPKNSGKTSKGGFMGKKWDYDVPSVEFWREVYRVLKPGGHVLSFGGTRTYHRMVINIEDAGFEIRDQIIWIYGSGFPKSHNIGKAIDKLQGNEREVVGEKTGGAYSSKTNLGINRSSLLGEGDGRKTAPTRGEDFGKITKGSSEYEGWGTALKPANEPICVARKPLSEKTIAENVLRWGTGGINVDGTRIKIEGIDDRSAGIRTGNFGDTELTPGDNESDPYITSPEGRFPANIIFDEDAAELLDEQTGYLKSGQGGGASRFFYVAKVSKKERNLGLDEFEDDWKQAVNKSTKNNHPTVKPINLLTYLCRLITPPNGTILDPFMGSGSTGIAAQLEGFNFVGMEMDPDYFKIAEARISNSEQYKTLKK